MTILEKIRNLTYFDGLRQLRLILEEFFSTVTALIISNSLVGRIIQYKGEAISEGTLQIGETYRIEELQLGDDFSNVGYVSDGVPFIATNTTPTTWTNGTAVATENTIYEIIFNDVDENVIVTNDPNSQDVNIIITNELFNVNKTFPNIPAGSSVRVVDTNTIYFNKQNTPRYFKIEVYI